MKLISLQLFNFRQFADKTQIEFANDARKNVTLIHGGNGSGKTTILNAFTWVLYGEFTDALKNPENLVNQQILMEKEIGVSVYCWVELLFQHSDTKYRLTRTRSVKRIDISPYWEQMGEDNVSLQFAGVEGKWSTVDPQDILDVLGRIIPNELLSYFFFDGERIEQLQRPNKRRETASAAALLTGDKVLERATRHIEEVGKLFEKKLKDIGDAETSALFAEKEKKENEIDQMELDVEQQERNLLGLEKIERKIKANLRELQETKDLQEERDSLEKGEREIQESLSALRNKIVEIFSSKGYLPILAPAIEKAESMINDLYDSGKIPSDIKRPFVESLLHKNLCICERALIPGTEPYDSVVRWLELSGMSSIEENAIGLRRDLQNIEKSQVKFVEELNELQGRRGQYKERLEKIEKRLGEIRVIIRNYPKEDIRELEIKHENCEKNIRGEIINKKINENKIKELRRQIDNIDQEVQKRKAKTIEQKLTQKRIGVCLEVRDILQRVRSEQHDAYRNSLSTRINRIFNEMSFKPHKAILNEDYMLELLQDNTSVPVGASTGESQMLSLSFIAAVIEQAKEMVSKEKHMLAPDSSDFPLVMDSPFGNLDNLYRNQVASSLPALANQSVFLLTKSQSEGSVLKAIEDRIGREYVLIYSSPKVEASEDSLFRKGTTYNLVQRSIDEYEQTELVEVI